MGWHLRPVRRVLGVLLPAALTVAMMSAGSPARAASVPWGTVLVPGSAWAGSYASLGDLNVYSNGDGDEDQIGPYGWEYECFELAARWADIAYGDPWNGWDASWAYQMYATGPYQSPPFLQRPNGGSLAPEFGDLLIFDQTPFDPGGHVAVVSGVGNGYVDIVEQNWGDPDPTGYAQVPIGATVNGVWDPTYMPDRWGLPIIGWLHSSVAPDMRAVAVGSGDPLSLPSGAAPSSSAEPAPVVSPPAAGPTAAALPTPTPSADPTAGTVGTGSSSGSGSGTGGTSAPPPCGCTIGAQFLPTGLVLSGPTGGGHAPPPSPSPPVAGASATPTPVSLEIVTMPPRDVPAPPIL